MAIIGEKETGVVKSIINFFLKWRGGSDGGTFTYYDKEKGTDVDYEVGQFIVLKTGYAIKGHSTKYNKPIFSNQIDKFTEELNVRCSVDGKMVDITKGVYSDIKSGIESAGGKLNIILTCLADNGDIIQIPLKGKAFANFLTFNDVNDTSKNKIKFVGAEDGQKGAIKYKTPIFEVGDDITSSELTNAVELANKLISGSVDEEVSDEATVDNLPF